MSRYFLALPLSDSVKEHLTAARPPNISGLKLVHPDQMHVTLHFLGDLQPEDLAQTKPALAKLAASPFSLDISGIGTFPLKGPLQIIWAGIEDCPELTALHLQLGELLQETIGFQPENRRFTPHVTLARVKRPIRREQLQDYWDRSREFRIAEIPIDRFVLYESVFTDGRLEYREDTSWELGA